MKKLEAPRGLTINFQPSAKQYIVWQTLQGNRCDKCGGELEMRADGVDKYGHPIWVPTCVKCGNTDIPEVILGVIMNFEGTAVAMVTPFNED